MSSDDDLYRKTLDHYNDPEFAKQYAASILDRLNERIFDEFLPFVPEGDKVLDYRIGWRS